MVKRSSVSRSSWLVAVAIVFLVVVDQLIKSWVQTAQSLNFGIFTVTFVKNTGAAFGLFAGNNAVFIWILFMALGAYLLFFERFSGASRVATLLICGGIVSNLLDRLFLGFVVDYINFGWFPVFNIADSMIVVGTLWLALLMLREEKTVQKKKSVVRKNSL